MSMLKKYISVAAVLALTLSPLMAQDNPEDSQEELLKKIVALQEENRALQDKSEALEKESEKLKADYDKQIENLNKQIDKLKDKSELGKANSLNHELSSKVDSLKEDEVKYRQQITALNSKVATLNDSLKDLNQQLADMAMFRKAFLMNQFKEADSYLQRPYSMIDMADLSRLRSSLREYSKDPEVRAALQNLDKAIGYKNNVSDMTLAINSPFDVQKIVKARNAFKQLSNNKADFSPEQWEEFDNLDIYLSRYNNAVAAFQQIINKINSTIETFGGDLSSPVLMEDCIQQINQVIAPYQEKDIPDRIYVIPYLKDRFDTYRKWATTSPGKKNPEILSIETEILNVNL